MSDTERVTAGDGRSPLPAGPAVTKSRRQRRPTGAPPPLPHPVTITTTAWLVLAVVILTTAFVAAQHGPWLRAEDQAGAWLLRQLAAIRTPWLTDVANGIKAAGTGWITVLGAAVIVLTMVFRRWRHLLVFLGSVLFLDITGSMIYQDEFPMAMQLLASGAVRTDRLLTHRFPLAEIARAFEAHSSPESIKVSVSI